MCCGKKGMLRECVCVPGDDGGCWEKRRRTSAACETEEFRWSARVDLNMEGLTGAHVELRAAHAVVSGWTVVKTLPVLPHPLPPQKQEEFGLAVYTAIVSGAHRAAFTDGVRSIASCRTNRGGNSKGG